MFSVSESLLVLSRVNRQLSTFDLVVDVPMRLFNVLAKAYKATITCLEENPMFPNFTPPTWLQSHNSGGVQPVYDKEFWSKTFEAVVALAFQTNGQIQRFEWFFFGRLLANYYFTWQFLIYNLAHYYI